MILRKLCWGRNIYVDVGPYLEGALGLAWFPSCKAKVDASQYEAWIEVTLRALCGRFTGSRLVLAISSKLGKVVIQPRDASPDPTDPLSRFVSERDRICNAEAKPVNKKDALIAGGPWFEDGKDYPTSKTTGYGSDCVIPFNPWVFDGRFCGPNVPLNRADFLLVHELTHAYASLSGKLATQESAPIVFGNLDEFAAIVVTNVYISETGGRQLVGGHSGEILPAALMPSQAFYDAYKEPLQRVCQNLQDFVRELRRPDAEAIPHNPFLCCDM